MTQSHAVHREQGPEVSIVVCTRNRADLLRGALKSLTVLRTDGHFHYEVIVVDNSSTDHTRRVSDEAAAASPVCFRYVYEPRPGRVYARNRGVAEAHGEWLAFFDDDQIADPAWLKELLAMAAQTQSRCVGGAVRLLLPEGCARKLSQPCRRLLGESAPWNVPRRYPWKHGPGAGNQLLHRSVFEQIGVYDESYNLRGEDTDLYRRMCGAGIESWYTPTAVVYHVTPEHRLTERYLRETSQQNGWSFARRDRERWGALIVPLVLLARLGQAAGLHLPRLMMAKLRRDAEGALGMRCRLWSNQGYLACALHLMIPRWFAQPRFATETPR